MQNIYFGKVEIQDTRTGAKQTVQNKIYLQNDTPPAQRLRAYVLKDIPQKEREKYKIIRFCFDCAIITGVTTH